MSTPRASNQPITRLRNAQKVVWESILESEPSKRAPLMAQWRALEKDITALQSKKKTEGDPIDEIAARRAARGGSTARTRTTVKRSR